MRIVPSVSQRDAASGEESPAPVVDGGPAAGVAAAAGRFVEVARRVARRKPILVVKSGRTAAGAKAASSRSASTARESWVHSTDSGF